MNGKMLKGIGFKAVLAAPVMILLIPLTAMSQNPGDTLWTRIYGGTLWDQGHAVTPTSDDGFLAVGMTASYGAGSADFWFVRTDAWGDTLWTRVYGWGREEIAHDIQPTFDGGYIVTGHTSSTATETSSIWLMKIDSAGDSLWTRIYGGPSWEKSFSVRQTSDSGYVIVGRTDSFGAGNYDVWMLRTDANGDTLWARTYGGSAREDGYCGQQTSDGGFIFTGSTYSFGSGSSDVWLVKTDANGDILWTQTFGGAYGEGGNTVQQTSDGGYIIAGYTFSYGAGSADNYLIKTYSNGNPEWIRTYGGVNAEMDQEAWQTFDGGYIVGGRTESFGMGEKDFYVMKIDSSGNISWEKTYGGHNYDFCFSIKQTADGGYVAFGYSASFSYPSDFYLVRIVGDSLVEIRGACCDDSTGVCDENVLQDSCTTRFTAFTSCADLNPSCGAINGCPEDELQVYIMTDEYPGETIWVLRDTAGTTVASGGPYAIPYNLYIDTVCVDSTGCYTFTIYDEWGDGIIIPGYYELYLNSDLIASNHSFMGDSAAVPYVGNGCPAITGACCDDNLADCNENIEQDSCQGPDVRFIIDGTCADFNPPCGGCPEDSIVIEIMTDDYPYETTWEILESGTSNVIGSGGPYNNYNTLFIEYLCVENSGCYDFVIYDYSGDGLCCDCGNGYYNVFLNGSLVAAGGEFDYLEMTAEIGYGCGGPGCDYVVGDVNGSSGYNGLDITYGVAFFKGGPAPLYECECTPGNIWYVSGDVNGSCNYNGLDITYGVAYFKGGPDPMPCPDCPPNPAVSISSDSGKLIRNDLDGYNTGDHVKKIKKQK
ncbi:MAG: hypothetical protein JSU85_01335 [Candidatus Zixiibacteriota bacterium]|nr:MAG: hypothetical protein JSU85_01335 [candidate division Zixibacteria bacterium]